MTQRNTVQDLTNYLAKQIAPPPLHDEEAAADKPYTSRTVQQLTQRIAALYEHITGNPIPGNDALTTDGHTHKRDGRESLIVDRVCDFSPHFLKSTYTSQTSGWSSPIGEWVIASDETDPDDNDGNDFGSDTQYLYWHQDLKNLHYVIAYDSDIDSTDWVKIVLRMYNEDDDIMAADCLFFDSSSAPADFDDHIFNFGGLNVDTITAGSPATITFDSATIPTESIEVGQRFTIISATNTANNGNYTIIAVNSSGGYITSVTYTNDDAVDEASSSPAVFERLANHGDNTGWCYLKLDAWVETASSTVYIRDNRAPFHQGGGNYGSLIG